MEVKLWLTGHSMDEVRSLSLEDIGNILAYWEDNRKADEKQKRTKAKLNKMSRGG